ncbi:MAG: CPBP family intramembrane metalloprotease, partial [Proteobacteria bacterium]
MKKFKINSVFLAVVLSLLPVAISLSDVILYDALKLRFDFASYEVGVSVLQLALALYLCSLRPSKLIAEGLRNKIVLSHFWFVCFGLATIAAGSIVTTLGNKLFFGLNLDIPEKLIALNPDNSIFTSPSMLTFVLAILLAPVIEELVFRQLLLNVWMKIFPSFAAIVVVSSFFALIHIPYPLVSDIAFYKFLLTGCPGYLVAGIAYGIARTRFSLWHAILLHMAFNAYLFAAPEEVRMSVKILGLACIPLT